MSKIALEKAVDSIFKDQGMVGLAKQLFCQPEWKNGVSTQSYLLTLEDYLGDLNEWLDPPFFKRALEVLSTQSQRHSVSLSASLWYLGSPCAIPVLAAACDCVCCFVALCTPAAVAVPACLWPVRMQQLISHLRTAVVPDGMFGDCVCCVIRR